MSAKWIASISMQEYNKKLLLKVHLIIYFKTNLHTVIELSDLKLDTFLWIKICKAIRYNEHLVQTEIHRNKNGVLIFLKIMIQRDTFPQTSKVLGFLEQNPRPPPKNPNCCHDLGLSHILYDFGNFIFINCIVLHKKYFTYGLSTCSLIKRSKCRTVATDTLISYKRRI